jgi:hypothetical protein
MTSTRDEYPWADRFLQVVQINALFRAFKRLFTHAQRRKAMKRFLDYVNRFEMRDYYVI